MVRVLIVEDHDMARVGLSVILGKIRTLKLQICQQTDKKVLIKPLNLLRML